MKTKLFCFFVLKFSSVFTFEFRVCVSHSTVFIQLNYYHWLHRNHILVVRRRQSHITCCHFRSVCECVSACHASSHSGVTATQQFTQSNNKKKRKKRARWCECASSNRYTLECLLSGRFVVAYSMFLALRNPNILKEAKYKNIQ